MLIRAVQGQTLGVAFNTYTERVVHALDISHNIICQFIIVLIILISIRCSFTINTVLNSVNCNYQLESEKLVFGPE